MTTPQADDLTNSWLGQIPVGQVIVFVIVVVGFGTVLAALWRKLRPLENFFKDWNGEAARPGVDARPGVMVRLDSIEDHIEGAPTRAEVDAIAGNLADLGKQVAANTVVVDLVRPHVVVDLPKVTP